MLSSHKAFGILQKTGLFLGVFNVITVFEILNWPMKKNENSKPKSTPRKILFHFFE
jgi:hypothetical protein